MTPVTWFALVAIAAFALMLPFPLAVWQRCGTETQRLLRNDPAFGFFTPLVFPVAMGTLAQAVAVELPAIPPGERVLLAAVFAIFGALAALLIHADMKIGPLEPYMTRDDAALQCEAEARGKLRALYRTAYASDLAPEQRQEAAGKITQLQRATAVTYSELAAGFSSWSDLRRRGALAAKTQVFVNSVVALGCAALFSWLLLAGYRALVTAKPTATANASMMCVALLMLWFPLRLYSEWYAGFYSFMSLRSYWTFWFLSVVAVVGVLLVATILKPQAITIAFSTAGTVLLLIFGTLAKLKPALVGYAAVVFEEMPLVPYLVTLVLGIFAVMLAFVLAITNQAA